MAEIEFVDDHGSADRGSDELPGDRGGPRRRFPVAVTAMDRRAREALGAVLYLAAAVLAIVSAVSTVYLVGFGSTGGLFRYSIDAAGRYQGVGELGRQGQHGARYSWLLGACVAVLSVLAVLHAAPLLRLPRAARFSRAASHLGVGVTGVLAGGVLAIYLDASAILDSVRSSTRLDVQSGDPVRADIVTRFGPCLWFSIGAVLCAASALVLTLATNRQDVTPAARASRSPAP